MRRHCRGACIDARFVVSSEMSDDERRLIDELVSVASTRGDDAREALARRLRAAADALHPSGASSSPPQVGRGHARTARGRRRNDDDDDDENDGNEGNDGNENSGFDFAAYPSRHVALHVMYAGWDYRGFASQGAERVGVRTVEEALFRALKRVRLIAPDATWKTCDYTRCGRTDAGVSALGQVVSARLRCRVPRDDDDDDLDDVEETGRRVGDEIDYPAVLNRALPRDIRILGWTYVPPAFSARFDCDYRHYKYFFTDWNGLDVPRHERGGEHVRGRARLSKLLQDGCAQRAQLPAPHRLVPRGGQRTGRRFCARRGHGPRRRRRRRSA